MILPSGPSLSHTMVIGQGDLPHALARFSFTCRTAARAGPPEITPWRVRSPWCAGGRIIR
jgi:hypothetical protein